MAEVSTALAAERRTVPRWLPWLTWGLGALLFCYGFFQRVAPSVMIDHLMRDLAVGGAVYTFINCAAVATGAVFQPLIGVMLDRGWEGALLDGARLYSPETYRLALSSLVVFLVVGLLAGLRLRETRPGVARGNRS